MVMELHSELVPSWTLPLHIRGQERTFIKGFEAPACLCFEKPAFAAGRSPGKLRCSFITGGLKTEDREDATLIDIEESSNGFVLFKFGTTEPYDHPPSFISSVQCEMVECLASISRLPDESTSVNSLKWDYNTVSLHERPFKPVHQALTCQLPMAIFSPNKQLGLPLVINSCYKPANGLGYLSMGIQGSDIITTIDSDWMDIISPNGLDCDCADKGVPDCLHGSSPNMMMVKLLPENICPEDVSTHMKNLGTEAVHSIKSSTIRRADRLRKKVRPRQTKPGKGVPRDLFKSGSFQLYEFFFSYPFMDSSKAALTWKTIPKEKYAELLNVLNQIAVGLAGSGLALVLFVASRMLCLNATMDSTKLMYLLRGVGLLWLSSALQKFGSVVRHMADFCGKSRPQRKEHLARFKEEVQAVAFKVCTLVMLSMVTLA